MFKTSVPLNDNNLNYASNHIAEFKADFGGTEIHNPLVDIFS